VRPLLFILLPAALLAHDPATTKLTWSAEISRIVYNRCSACHRDGGVAPMALLEYDEVRPWAKGMRDEVLARRMPPWGAVKGFGEFRDDISLTQDEITRIAEWVEGGAPEGDPRLLPATPVPRVVLSSMPKGARLRRPVRLTRAASVLAIAPAGAIEGAKITARKPDGSIVPLLWLLNYRGKFQRTYVYRQAVELPAGTVLESVPRVAFDLIVRQTASTGIVKATVLTTPRR
jgi:hypothetical protein